MTLRFSPATLFIATLASLIAILMAGGTAKAEVSPFYPVVPAEATYRCRAGGPCAPNPGDSPSPIYITVGSGEFTNNEAYTKVYSFGPTYTVNIIEGMICGSVVNDGFYTEQAPDISNTAFTTSFDFTGITGGIIQTVSLGADCGTRNRSYTITLPASSLNAVTGRYEGYIVARMVSPSGNTNENSFRYQFTGAEAGMGNPYGNATFAYSNRNVPSGFVHDASVVFAPTCNMPPTGNGTIEIFDVDRGQYQAVGNYPELIWVVYQRARGTAGNGGWTAAAFGTLMGGDDATDSLPFAYQNTREYRLQVRGLSRPNALMMRVTGVSVEAFPAATVCTRPAPVTCPDYGFTAGTGGSGGGGPSLTAPGFTAQTISSSSDASNRVCQINMQDYRDYISDVNWPLRSDGCSPQTGYKPFPVVPDSRQFAIGPYSGNVFNLSGNCSSAFDDGGSTAGAWMKPTALGGWATDASTFSGSVPYAGSSGKLSRCPANAKIVWGRDTVDPADHARPLFADNGTPYPGGPPFNSFNATSNGTTLLRNNFVLTQAQLDSLNDPATTLSLRIVADDFYQVYINGNLVITENNTASPTSTDLTSSKSLFRLGNNSIAIQAVDKLVWRNNVANLATTGFGLCYSLDLLRPIPPSDPATSCSLTPISLEPGGVYYPRMQFTNSDVGSPTATVGVDFSIDGLAGSSRTASGISVPAPVSPATSVVRTAYVTSPDFTPQSGDVAFTADTPISLPTPGSYTARYDWSWTAGSYSGPPAPVAPATTNDCVVTIIVASRPYFKALGDVITQDPASVINGWNQALGGLGYEATFPVNAGGNFGAGAQGMILSAGPTTGVASRFRNTGGNPRSFTLANTTPPGDLTWGGNFGSPLLMPAPLLDNLTPVDTTNSIAGIASGMYSLAGGTLTGGVIAPGRQVTIYVNGDVRIVSGGGSGITYANSNSYPNRSMIPRFRLIATGSIYIDPGVTQLDGEYIAGNGGSGDIYTCFSAGWSAPLDGTTENPYGVCGGTLIVNGALLADSIKLTRAVGTLRGAQANDADLLLVGPTDYQNASNISEIIQFTPELFLVNPAGPPSDSSPNRYDSITALPPLF